MPDDLRALLAPASAVAAAMPHRGRGWRRGDRRRQVQLICAQCGGSFYRHRSNVKHGTDRHYCGENCRLADKARQHPRLVVSARCEACSTIFDLPQRIGPRARRRFCSTPCRYASRTVCADPAERRRQAVRRRKARRRANSLTGLGHTEAQWLKLLAAFGGKCAECRSTRQIERDHIIPLSKDGTDEITNIQPLCRSCNARKGAKRTQLL